MAETTETLKSIENKTIHLEHKKTKNKNFLAPLQRRLFADDSSDNKRDEKFYFDKKSKNKLGEKTKQKNYFDKTKQKRTAKCFPKVVKRVSLGGVSSFNRYRSPSPNKNRGWQTPPANYQPWTPKNVRKSYEDVMVSRETPKLKCISPEKKFILRFYIY
ncbi:hypothetical protein MHBO_004405 [Bonamia ostreae]|uniref:Uncharacterized protein n=1 Tax=Bonamia ostreae TaxID=126728 RepID=A0ABV2AT87_9EUKA